MTTIPKNRIASVDLLKGVVMVIMALDHVRDYVHFSTHYFDPIDPAHSNLPTYFSRFITNYSAPTFSFLAGLSAFFVGRRKSPGELSSFLLKRGIWLVFLEVTFVSFAWYFNIFFRNTDLAVIWCLGLSMIFLALIIYLPRKAILLFSCLLLFGHNLLDNIHFPGNFLWSALHEQAIYKLPYDHVVTMFYPIVPWIGVMALGYCFGPLYSADYGAEKRKKLISTIGIAAVVLFLVVRYINVYGDPVPWKHYDSATRTFMSFFNICKYPPSLLYLLITLGPALVFLANSETWKGRIVNFFSTFGRVPFFYYMLHLYLIHLIAMALAQLSGFGWQKMVLNDWVADAPILKGYGFSLWVVYLVWICVILALYPLCKQFDLYKQSHKDKWWLSYL